MLWFASWSEEAYHETSSSLPEPSVSVASRRSFMSLPRGGVDRISEACCTGQCSCRARMYAIEAVWALLTESWYCRAAQGATIATEGCVTSSQYDPRHIASFPGCKAHGTTTSTVRAGLASPLGTRRPKTLTRCTCDSLGSLPCHFCSGTPHGHIFPCISVP